jgi:hypothetical protein
LAIFTAREEIKCEGKMVKQMSISGFGGHIFPAENVATKADNSLPGPGSNACVCRISG